MRNQLHFLLKGSKVDFPVPNFQTLTGMLQEAEKSASEASVKAIASGDYSGGSVSLARAAKIASLLNKIMSMKQDWDELFGVAVDSVPAPAPAAAPTAKPKVSAKPAPKATKPSAKASEAKVEAAPLPATERVQAPTAEPAASKRGVKPTIAKPPAKGAAFKGKTKPASSKVQPKVAQEKAKPKAAVKAAPSKKGGKVNRIQYGALVPSSDYEKAILQALADLGGTALRKDFAAKAFDSLKKKMSPLDLEATVSHPDTPRWQVKMTRVMIKMSKEGFIRSGSKLGEWILTDAGRAKL